MDRKAFRAAICSLHRDDTRPEVYDIRVEWLGVSSLNNMILKDIAISFRFKSVFSLTVYFYLSLYG
jgi:hypothetical protein